MPSQNDIKTFLIQQDKILEPVILQCRYPKSRLNNDIYYALLSSIVSQQLSVKAADTIFNRFVGMFRNNYPEPDLVCRMSLSRMRQAGLSRQKAGYIKEVASYALKNGGLTKKQFNRRSDEEVIKHLTQIRGVGKWTVEMILMFAMDRKDVFSADDLGIQQAMKHMYKLKLSGPELKQEMVRIAEYWRPYRSVVCKYLWQWKSLPR